MKRHSKDTSTDSLTHLSHYAGLRRRMFHQHETAETKKGQSGGFWRILRRRDAARVR